MRCLLALTLGVLAAAAQTTNPFANDPAAPGAGLGIFHIYCASCHGNRAQGGRAPDLTRGTFSVGDRDEDLFRTISEGIPGTEMSAYARLGPDTIWRIVAFLRSSARHESAPEGNAAKGEALFWGKGGCGTCHSAGNRGNRLGPDLSTIGRRRSLAYIRESLLDPSADIVPEFHGVTVVTKEGTTIHGVEKFLDDFSVIVLDLNGRYRSFDRADVRSVTQDEKSLMPAYGHAFNAAELNDILAYLLTLRGAEVKR